LIEQIINIFPRMNSGKQIEKEKRIGSRTEPRGEATFKAKWPEEEVPQRVR
jgi:hypothetical protein